MKNSAAILAMSSALILGASIGDAYGGGRSFSSRTSDQDKSASPNKKKRRKAQKAARRKNR